MVNFCSFGASFAVSVSKETINAAWLILHKDNFTGEWDNAISSVYTYDKFCMFYEYVSQVCEE